MAKGTGGVSERVQWVVILAGFAVVLGIVYFQNLQLQKLSDLAAGAGGVVVKTVAPKNTNANANVGTNANAPAATVKNFGIPGLNATIVVPGSWKTVGSTQKVLQFQAGSGGLDIERRTIGGGDLQAWFNENYGAAATTPLKFVADTVAEAVKAGMDVTGSDIKITGPNQVEVAGNLAMDMTIAYQKQFFPEETSPSTQRFVVVRRGGDVIVFEMTVPTADAPAFLAEFDQMLSSLTFAK